MIANTGWTFDYVEEELDLPRLLALQKHWRRHPPTHVLLAAFVGFKPPADPDHINTAAELEMLMDLGRQVPPKPKDAP